MGNIVVCPHCGKKNSSLDGFCSKCGEYLFSTPNTNVDINTSGQEDNFNTNDDTNHIDHNNDLLQEKNAKLASLLERFEKYKRNNQSTNQSTPIIFLIVFFGLWFGGLGFGLFASISNNEYEAVVPLSIMIFFGILFLFIMLMSTKKSKKK